MPEKKKRKSRKKKEEPDTTPDVTKAELIGEIRKNVAKTEGEEFALDILNKYQSGATMSSLREEFYEPIYSELKAANDE